MNTPSGEQGGPSVSRVFLSRFCPSFFSDTNICWSEICARWAGMPRFVQVVLFQSGEVVRVLWILQMKFQDIYPNGDVGVLEIGQGIVGERAGGGK